MCMRALIGSCVPGHTIIHKRTHLIMMRYVRGCVNVATTSVDIGVFESINILHFWVQSDLLCTKGGDAI
jgi:hypothetical protein